MLLRLAPRAVPAFIACVGLSALALPGRCLADASYTISAFSSGNPQADIANLFGQEILKVGPDGTPILLPNDRDYSGPVPTGMAAGPLATPFRTSDDGHFGVGTTFEQPGGGANWAAFGVHDGVATPIALPASLAADPEHFSAAAAVNNSGMAVGTIGSNGDSRWNHAVVTGPGGSTWTDIGTLGGNFSSALGISNSGLVVGSSTVSPNSSGFHAFLYDGKTMLDLNTVIPPTSGWTLLSATGVDDEGRIAVYGTDGSSVHQLLLTPGTLPPPEPIPEPSTLALFGAAGALAWGVRRRRARAAAPAK